MPHIYKTLTGSRDHDRQFHYSQAGQKVGEGSIRDTETRIQKDAPSHSVVLTLLQKGVFEEKNKFTLTPGELSSHWQKHLFANGALLRLLAGEQVLTGRN